MTMFDVALVLSLARLDRAIIQVSYKLHVVSFFDDTLHLESLQISKMKNGHYFPNRPVFSCPFFRWWGLQCLCVEKGYLQALGLVVSIIILHWST